MGRGQIECSGDQKARPVDDPGADVPAGRGVRPEGPACSRCHAPVAAEAAARYANRSRRLAGRHAGLGAAAVTALPGAPDIARRDGRLFVEDVAVADLARRFVTPLYVYSTAAMARALAGYRRALDGRDHLVCYAVKANSSLAVLQTFARRGCGFDIVSGGELERVIAAGGDPSLVVFSGVGKTAAEMSQALAAGVLCFNVESVGELERLSGVASAMQRTAQVSLRVNPDVDARTHPYISTGLRASKFGIAHEQARAGRSRCRD